MLSFVLFAIFVVGLRANFIKDPESVTATEGQSLRLSCESSYYDDGQTCDSYLYYWIRRTASSSRDELTDCRSVENDFRGRMNVTKNNGLYTLYIHQVSTEDAGNYYCYIYYSGYDYYSSPAALTVNSPPENPPSCEVLPKTPTVGSSAKLGCQLSALDPSSLLTWIESDSGQVVPPEPTGPTVPGGYYVVDLDLTETDNNKQFTCVAGPDLVHGPKCVITPLQIPTNVSVIPSPSVVVSEGRVASFRCTSESIPAASEFRWRAIRNDGSMVKINANTISSLGDAYRLSDTGHILEILNVSVTVFNNTRIWCNARNSLESVNSGETVLLVVRPDTPATEKPTTTSLKGPTDTGVGNNPNTGLIVGGVLGVIFLLILIAALGCYLFKSRRVGFKRPFAEAQYHNSPAHERLSMTVVQASPTYEEVPHNTDERHDLQDESWSSWDGSAHAQPPLYAEPDRAQREGVQAGSSPTYTNSSGYVNLPRHSVERAPSVENGKRVSIGHVAYAVPEKRDRARPEPIGSEATQGGNDPAEDARQPEDDPKLKNAEGLVYADLQLDSHQAARVDSEQQDESINYASIRGDMAEIRNLLSRD